MTKTSKNLTISNMHWQVYVLLLFFELSVPWQIRAQPSTSNNNADNTHPLYEPREPYTQQVFNVSLQGKQPSAQTYDLNMPQNMAAEHKSENKEVDGDASKKIIGSSVVTSVSVILNGDQPEFTDALGHKIPKPQASLPVQVASPIDLLNPDRYEFYTFDDNGDLVRRLMTLQEIQSIVANGDGEGPNIIHTAPIDDRDPEKNVQDIVYSVQNVLNKQVENTKNSNSTNKIPALDTPDVSSTWAMILPAIFGNTGGEIYPEQKPQQIAMTPDSEILETPTKTVAAGIEQSTKKPKPSKRKPGQKRKTTTTTTTPEITPQIVQEELASHETVYTGIKHYEHIAANVQDFQQFSNIHMQPIYNKLSETTTKRIYINNEEIVQSNSTTQKKPSQSITANNTIKAQHNQHLVKKPAITQSQSSIPNRKNATKRPRPTQKLKGQKKPVAGQVQTQSTVHTKAKPIKTTTAATTATVIPGTSSSSTAATSTTVQKKKKKKPARPANSDTNLQQATALKRKPTTAQRVKPTKASSGKPLNDQVTQDAQIQEIVHKTHHRTKPKPTKHVTATPTTTAHLVSQIYPGLATSSTPEPKISTSTEEQKYVSPSYPIPTYSIEQPAPNAAEEIVINQLKTQAFPSLSLLQQQYQQPQVDETLDTQTEDNLKLSIGQIVQSLKQTTTNSGIITDKEQSLKPHAYDSAESLDKLEELANKRKAPYIPTKPIVEQEIPTLTSKPISEQTKDIIKTEELFTTNEKQVDVELPSTTTTANEIKISENISNVIKFEPLVADVQEPIVMDLATTTLATTTAAEFDTEMATESDIDSTTNIKSDESLAETTTQSLLEKTVSSEEENEGLPILLPQQVEMFLEQRMQENDMTTEVPPNIADLNSQFNLEAIKQHNTMPMSDLQKQVATVASHLIDGGTKSIEMNNDTKEANENTEIEQLITDVMQQVTSENNANEEHNRLTNFAQLNTSYLWQQPTTALGAGSSGQNINNSLSDSLLEDDTLMITTESSTWIDEAIATSTKSASTDDESTESDESSFELITLPIETTTIAALNHFDEEQYEMSTEIKYNLPSITTTSTTIIPLKHQFEQNVQDKIKQATNSVPIKLNKSEQSSIDTFSSVEEFLKYNSTAVPQASDEQENAAAAETANTENKFDSEQMLATTVTPSDNTENETEIPKVGMNADSSEIKVNDATTEKEADKQESEIKYNMIAGAAQVATENAFTTETSASKLDETANPINTEPQTTANLEILSAIDNNSQETMSEMESGTEISLDTTTLSFDITTPYASEEEDTTAAEQTTRIVESTSVASAQATHSKEDPYVKLGELPQIHTNKTSEEQTNQPTNITLIQADTPITALHENESTLKETKIITEKPDDEDEDDQTQTATTSTTQAPNKRLSTLKPVSYYKQPSFAAYMQPEFPKPVTYISAQRPMQRPAALTNLMAASTVATRPPVKLDPSPSHSKGLEASTLGLEDDVLQFAKLCNELAFSYWKSITSEKVSSARSLIISPFALTSMLSMVFLGARGSTSGEMNEVLKLDDMVTFNPHLIFKNITDSVERAMDSDIATTAFVREIFSDRANGRVLPFFKEKTQQFYAGHVEEVNFHVVNDIIRRRTNLLVKRHTMGKVQEYLRTNSVWVNGPLATISANLFQTDCSRASTSDRDGELFFQVHPTVRQRRLIPIPAVLYKTGFTAGYDTKLDATVVAFGRIQDTVSTIYIMPGLQNSMSLTDNLDQLEKQLIELAFTENAWSNLLTTLMDRPGLEVQLPRFSHRSFVNASLGLQKMGLKGLFKSEFADLRGLTGSAHHDVFLSDMIQINTFSTCGDERIADHHHVEMYPAPPLRKRNKDVDANEDDTLDSSEAIIDFGSLVQESALARSFYDDDLLDPKYLELPLPLRPRQARVPDAPPRLRFDKPFLYFVRHNPTGIILFMGRFNPRLLP